MVNQGKTEVPEQNTLIGEATCIRGSLRGSTDLIIHGRIEGELRSEGSVFVEQHGVVKASVLATSIIVKGVVVGDIMATQSVQIASEGRVVGNICTPRFSMAEGALYRGHVETDEEVVRDTLANIESKVATQSTVRTVVAHTAAVPMAAQQRSRIAPSSAPRGAIPTPPPAPARVTFKPVEAKAVRATERMLPPAPPPAPPAPFQGMLLRDDDMFPGIGLSDDSAPSPAMIGKRKSTLKAKS